MGSCFICSTRKVARVCWKSDKSRPLHKKQFVKKGDHWLNTNYWTARTLSWSILHPFFDFFLLKTLNRSRICEPNYPWIKFYYPYYPLLLSLLDSSKRTRTLSYVVLVVWKFSFLVDSDLVWWSNDLSESVGASPHMYKPSFRVSGSVELKCTSPV